MAFDRLIHFDWSISPRKRWGAEAVRTQNGWAISAPERAAPDLLDRAFRISEGARVLAAFDFPIGVPRVFGEATGLKGFRTLLDVLGSPPWDKFYDVCRAPEEVSLHRPFYPQTAKKGVRRATLVEGLGVASFDALYRQCERAGDGGRDACALFWTLGGNQVGRAALSGWREIIAPALRRGARLWPFDGPLDELSQTPGLVIAESYPALAYRLVGAGFAPGESKRRQADRATKAEAITRWAAGSGVALAERLKVALRDGFGRGSDGEDAFDALAGLCKMIEVVDGRCEAGDTLDAVWEGWILGR
jgi:hypothetical protein